MYFSSLGQLAMLLPCVCVRVERAGAEVVGLSLATLQRCRLAFLKDGVMQCWDVVHGVSLGRCEATAGDADAQAEQRAIQWIPMLRSGTAHTGVGFGSPRSAPCLDLMRSSRRNKLTC